MTTGLFDSALYSGIYGDAEAAAILCEGSFVARMVEVEAAYALACAEAGVIPPEAGRAIADRLAGLAIAPGNLAEGTASAGVPVPALVAALRRELGEHGQWLHWGPTSQDIVDTALVLQWRAMLDLLGYRLGALLDRMESESETWKDQLMAARTRSQVATPISLGFRIAGWAQPLISCEQELLRLRQQLLKAQIGGAGGTLSVLGDRGEAVTRAFADALDLSPAPSWHTDRSAWMALGNWLAALGAGLSKMARDLIVAGRSEIGEMQAGTGGGSSTMPQKSNPVAAEAIVSLAAWIAQLQPLLAIAAAPLEERDGSAWALEWMALPPMGVAAAAALGHARGLIESLSVDSDRMRARLHENNGAIMAEAASFALALHMPRAEAQALVKDLLASARVGGISLAAALAEDPRTASLARWETALDPAADLAAAESMRRRILARRRP